MNETSVNGRTSTRRSFLKKGSILAAPLAAVGVPAAVMADDELKLRLARLENEAAIRELHQKWLRSIHSGVADGGAAPFQSSTAVVVDAAVRGIASDHSGQPDMIRVAADGKSAIGRFQCTVELETPIAQDCTLGQMAHAQGGGFVRRSERGVLNVEYVKNSADWKIAKTEFEHEIS